MENYMYKEKELIKIISDAISDKDWNRAKEFNSALADIEINNKSKYFKHYPEALQIEITSKCNGRCVMCSHYYELNDCGSDIDENVFALLEEYLPYCRIVLLNGYGEPFISRHFLPMLRCLEQYQVKAITTTNLSVLTDEMLSLIPKVFSEIKISCTGFDEVTYEKIHCGLSFNTLKENMHRLIEACGSNILSLSCVAMTETAPWAENIVRFANDIGIKNVRFGRLGVSRFVRNYDQDLTKYPNFSSFHFQKAAETARELGVEIVYPEYYSGENDTEKMLEEIKLIKENGFRYNAGYGNILRKEFLEYFNEGTYGNHPQKIDIRPIKCSGICDWVGKGMYIDSAGNMFSCCESKIGKYCDGWFGDDAKELRHSFFTGLLPNFCKNCPFIANGELKMLECEKNNLLFRAVE